MPLALNLKYKNLCYGFARGQYTDLCQPIFKEEDLVEVNGKTYDIPVGSLPDASQRHKTGIHVWNYDYSFKTYERAKELLYYFEKSHEKVFGAGQYGAKGADITPEYAMNSFLKLAEGRYKRCYKSFPYQEHPKHIQERVKNIKPEEFGHSLWNKILL